MNKTSRQDRNISARRANKTERSVDNDNDRCVMMTNTDNAPIIFADKVPAYGTIGGVITTTLAAERPVGGNIAISATVHLRLTRDAAKLLAKSLLEAIEILDSPFEVMKTVN